MLLWCGAAGTVAAAMVADMLRVLCVSESESKCVFVWFAVIAVLACYFVFGLLLILHKWTATILL